MTSTFIERYPQQLSTKMDQKDLDGLKKIKIMAVEHLRWI